MSGKVNPESPSALEAFYDRGMETRAMNSISPSELLDFRLANLQISRSDFRTPGDVAGWLGATQAQDYLGAKWSLGLRLPGAVDADIERAIAEKTIVRTWIHRGTLHFVSAADVHWMLKLLGPRILPRLAGPCEKLGLTDAVIARSQAVMAEALRGGKALTRPELARALNENGIATEGLCITYLLYRAAVDRLICHGSRRGNQFTFVLLDEWIPETNRIEGEEALAELAIRYFRSHGPATLQDFAWWSGQTLAAARNGLEMVKPGLASASLDGEAYWMPQDQPSGKDMAGGVYLLPGFDEYMLGYKDRNAVIPAEQLAALTPKNGMFSPIIVIHGRVAGTWKRSLGTKSVVIETSPFAPLCRTHSSAVEAAAMRFREYAGREGD
jgi:hypothetical protein